MALTLLPIFIFLCQSYYPMFSLELVGTFLIMPNLIALHILRCETVFIEKSSLEPES